MGLLAADLRALGNLPATRLGRRVVVSAGIGFALLGMLAWWFARAIVDHPYALERVHRLSGGEAQHALFGYGLMACPLVATWLGLALGQRQLFDAPELLLWRQAPIAGWRAPVQVLLRATFLSVCWASSLALPFLAAVLSRTPAPGLALALAPVAIAGATAPLLATLLAVHVVLVRFFAGRWLRLVFVGLGAAASVGFSTWLLLTIFGRGSAHVEGVEAIARAPERLPWTVDTGARLLAAAARGQLDVGALARLLGWLAVSWLGFALIAQLHPRALERHLAAEPPLWKSRGRRWPASVAGTVLRKELAQILQQPGALIAFLVFAVLVFTLCRQQVMVGGLLTTGGAPRDLVQLAVMLMQWFLAVLLVLYAHMGRLVLWDAPQWSLWVVAPAAPGALLRGKLTALFVLLLWPLLLVAVAGALLLDASAATLLVYVGAALAGTLVAVGVLAIVGTSPRLVRPDESGHAAQGGKGFLGALLLVVVFQASLLPAVLVWQALLARHHEVERALTFARIGPWLGGALGYGALFAALGAAVGALNLRRLLRPR